MLADFPPRAANGARCPMLRFGKVCALPTAIKRAASGTFVTPPKKTRVRAGDPVMKWRIASAGRSRVPKLRCLITTSSWWGKLHPKRGTSNFRLAEEEEELQRPRA